MAVCVVRITTDQGCPQDVKSQDRDGQLSRPRRDRGVPFFQTLKTETLNPQDRGETETFHFPKLSRPRRDRDGQPSRPRRDRDVPKKRIETAVSQFENTNW